MFVFCWWRCHNFDLCRAVPSYAVADSSLREIEQWFPVPKPVVLVRPFRARFNRSCLNCQSYYQKMVMVSTCSNHETLWNFKGLQTLGLTIKSEAIGNSSLRNSCESSGNCNGCLSMFQNVVICQTTFPTTRKQSVPFFATNPWCVFSFRTEKTGTETYRNNTINTDIDLEPKLTMLHYFVWLHLCTVAS